MAFTVNPLVTDRLKSPIAARFVNFCWLTTPYNANMRILVVVAAHAGPNLLLSHLDIYFRNFDKIIGVEGLKKVAFFAGVEA